MKKFTIFLVMVNILIISCGKDKPTQPPAQQGSLLSSRLIVSMVPGRSETVAICAVKPDGTPDNLTLINSDPDVAMATLTDSTIQITGLNVGTTNLSVRSQCGQILILPVQVYSPYVLETAELQITFVDSFTLRWNDHGSGGDNDGSFFHPVTSNGFRAVGSLGCGPDGYPDPNGTYAIMVVKAKPGHEDALAEPTGYELIYNDRNSHAYMYGSFWRPIPPDGYTALGTVVADNTWDPPSLGDVVCVRSDLTTLAESGNFIYDDRNTGADMYLSCWKIDQPTTGPHDMAYLATGTFVGVGNWDRPFIDPVLFVLKVDMPTLAEASDQNFIPKLTSCGTPPEETVPMMARAMLVPCSIINDLTYNGNIGWQVANSPLYRLERQIFYKLQYHNYNQTSEVQTNNVTIRSGITTTESERIWDETSISVSVELGLSIMSIPTKVTGTISNTFGYETQTSVAELQEKEVSTSINTSPGKAAALWQKYTRFTLYRHNGLELEPVRSWELGIDSYVTDEYPH